jgi:uncharacterized protein YuzE
MKYAAQNFLEGDDIMFTKLIQLVEQTCLLLFLAGILSFTLTSIAFAEIGNSKSQIEQRYGDYTLVQDGFNRIWTQNEWKSALHSGAKAYGYMTTVKEMNATIWIEYNEQNQVVKETIIMDGSIKIRDFQNYFSELYTTITAADSSVFVIRTSPKEQLRVIVHKSDKKYNLIRFFMDNLNDNTKINMHSKIHGFEITEITSGDVKDYFRTSRSTRFVSKVNGQQASPDVIWLRTDNYFQSELFFSENLMPRKKTDMIVIHHTAIEDMSVADIHELHLKKGWAGIAYHKVILPDGVAQNGRPQNLIGAHAQGANPRSIGVVLVGNFESKPPAFAQMDALVKLTMELMQKYHIPVENVVPHREITQGTTCPGVLFPWEEFIQRLKTNSGKLEY